MLASTFVAGAAILGSAVAAPYNPFPLADGFPSPSSSALVAIETGAGGTLPTTPPPNGTITNSSATALELIAFNEIFEVAYFTQLLSNITNNVTGYQVPAQYGREAATAIFSRIIDQEQLHALEANTALQHFGFPAIKPCQYTFPVTNLTQAIKLANTFTDLVLGTLQDANAGFAAAGLPLTRLIDSVIGQEGEQVGFFRVFQLKPPSAAPFLTTSAAAFAFSALQQFVIPGSCPNENQINITPFEPLNVLTSTIPAGKDSEIELSWSSANSTKMPTNIVYITGQNVPVVVNYTVVSTQSGVTTAKASFPFLSKGFSDGLTIAAATTSAGPFADADAVANHAVFGPGLIEVA